MQTPATYNVDEDPRILTIRGRRVILDSDLAQLYGVSTKRLNEQVRRNVANHDQAITDILAAIRSLMNPAPPTHRRPIGFIGTEEPALAQ